MDSWPCHSRESLARTGSEARWRGVVLRAAGEGKRPRAPVPACPGVNTPSQSAQEIRLLPDHELAMSYSLTWAQPSPAERSPIPLNPAQRSRTQPNAAERLRSSLSVPSCSAPCGPGGSCSRRRCRGTGRGAQPAEPGVRAASLSRQDMEAPGGSWVWVGVVPCVAAQQL